MIMGFSDSCADYIVRARTSMIIPADRTVACRYHKLRLFRGVVIVCLVLCACVYLCVQCYRPSVLGIVVVHIDTRKVFPLQP